MFIIKMFSVLTLINSPAYSINYEKQETQKLVCECY